MQGATRLRAVSLRWQQSVFGVVRMMLIANLR